MRIKAVSTAVTVALTCLLAFVGGAIEAKSEEADNNLSYPAILIDGTSTFDFFAVLGADEALGTTYSYGCEGTEMLETFSYPNISCVNDLASPTIFYTAAECIAEGGKCAGKSVDRIYWQKVTDNQWSSQLTGVPSTGGSAPVNVRFVDWGDSIEVINWNENSVLRVETQPFVDLGQDPLTEIPPATPQTQTGYQMYHVSGQGITEQWGARVAEDAGGARAMLPYYYHSPYAIINAGTADLYLTKLFPVDATATGYECPAVGGGQTPVYPADYPFQRAWVAGEGWSNSCNLPIVPYTLEQSVSGKYVHVYNWRMNDLPDPLATSDCGNATWQKTGWWRLTYVPNGGASKMLFTDNTVTSAPVLLTEASEVETTLYTPVVDINNNLTYIDICIVEKSSSSTVYTISPSVIGSGTISPSTNQVVEENRTVTFILDPADHFSEVTGTCPAGTLGDNGDGTLNYITDRITNDCSVIATFEKVFSWSMFLPAITHKAKP
ncbi:MAG: hypothetical protein PHZ02_00440 [Desulfocapsaceae bacterium]|nr:hypothetical protein [Desulfocapsaceae bacterium]